MSAKQSVLKGRLKKSESKKARARLAAQQRWTKDIKQCTANNEKSCRPTTISNLSAQSSDQQGRSASKCSLSLTCYQPSTSSDSRSALSVPTVESPKSTGEKKEFKIRVSDLDTSLRDFETNLGQDDDDESMDYKIIDTRCLQNLFNGLLCPSCKLQSLSFKTSNRYGFAHTMEVECEECLYSAESSSSHKIEGSAALDVNRHMVKYMISTGQGFSSMERFCMTLNMESMSNNTFNKHMSALSVDSILSCRLNLEKTRERVREDCKTLENQTCDLTEPIDISDSFDGTWHKRGFTSNYGVSIVIELNTELVINFYVLSKYCHTCAITKSELGEESPELHFWFEGHKDTCSIHYKGSSPAMEVHAAEQLWRRSLSHGFRYTTVLSDGDSKAFSHLQELHIYDKEIITEECANHVAKRLGTGLRKVVKEGKTKKVTLGGKKHGSLKESSIVKLTKYYKNRIIRNKENPAQIKSDVFTTLHQYVSTDKTPRHNKCPDGEESWCFYKRALAKGETPGSHVIHVKTPISETVLRHILPVYQRLANNNLLERCAKGLTQNANESLNSLIWNKWTKTRNASKRTVEAAVAEAVNEFNFGYLAISSSMNTSKIKTGLQGRRILLIRDKKRMKMAKRKITQKYQNYRRK